MCLASDKVSATEGEQARMRCPIWLAIPARDMGVRAEVYMQVHRVFQMPPLFARLWAQLSFGNPEPKEHDEFLSYSHMVTKIMSLRNGSTKWLRAYIRLSDIVIREELTATTVFDVMVGIGGLESFISSFLIGFVALGSVASVLCRRAEESESSSPTGTTRTTQGEADV